MRALDLKAAECWMPKTLRPLRRFETYFWFVLKDLESGRPDFGEMGKQIFAAVVRLDGPKSFRIIEPLFGARRH
jgi:hypothetical protein